MAVPQSVRKSATSGKPEDRRAFPPDPRDQGRSVRTGIAEDALLSESTTCIDSECSPSVLLLTRSKYQFALAANARKVPRLDFVERT